MKKSKIALILIVMLTIVALATQVTAQVGTVLKASLTNYDPAPASPGDTVDLFIRFTNDGVNRATNVQVQFVDSYPFVLLSESDRIISIGSIEPGADYLLTYRVRVDSGAQEGTSKIALKFKQGSESEFVRQSNIPLEIRSTNAPVSITKVDIDPKTLIPGSKGTITISVKNMAKASSVRDVSINLGLTPVVSATSVLIDYPFVPLNSGNEKTIDKIGPGQTAEFEFEIAAYPTAESMLYKVPVTLSYTDDAGATSSDLTLIGLEVNTVPELLVSIDESELSTKMSKGKITFSITNKGINDVKLMTITLDESEKYTVLEASNEKYIGNIDSDDFETIKYEVKLEESGDVTFPVTINYKDSLNNNYEKDYELHFIVREPEQQDNAGSTWIIIIIIIIAVVAFLVYRSRKKKKQK